MQWRNYQFDGDNKTLETNRFSIMHKEATYRQSQTHTDYPYFWELLVPRPSVRPETTMHLLQT